MWMDNWVLNLPRRAWPSPVLFRFFETQRAVVVLANSNTVENEVQADVCAQKGIPVLTRKGGGGTVVLSPGCLVLTLAFYASDVFSNARYFSAVNELWIKALKENGIGGLAQGGISDITAGDKKIAGTSLFRKKHLLVYQGSLLVNPRIDLIESCLKHPTREPDYRNKRGHREFLTSVQMLGYSISAENLGLACTEFFNKFAVSELREHLQKA